jgi:hypothetical protein
MTILQVTKEDYESCNKTKPIAIYDTGCTVVALNRSGPFYFIDGRERECEINDHKFMIVVKSKGLWSRFKDWMRNL